MTQPCPDPNPFPAEAVSPYKDVRLGLERPSTIALSDLLSPQTLDRSRPAAGGASPGLGDSFATGRYLCATIRPGLQYIDAEMTGLREVRTETLAPRCLRLSALIEGESRTTIEGRHYHHAHGAVPQLAGVGQDTPMLFAQSPGQRVRMSGLLMMPEFLEQLAADLHEHAAPLAQLIAPGVHFHALQGAARLRELLIALHASPYHGALGELHRESLALGLVVELVALIQGGQGALVPEPAQAERLARDARARIDRDPGAITSAMALAHDLGTNETSLRRAFQQSFGVPLFEYVRARRLDQARALVCDTRLQIAEIARRSGYSSPANFTNAYRQRFGLNPRADRGRSTPTATAAPRVSRTAHGPSAAPDCGPPGAR